MSKSTSRARDEFSRLMEMVLAAQDFGLERPQACAVAQSVLDSASPEQDTVDAVAGALAQRILEKVRRDAVSVP